MYKRHRQVVCGLCKSAASDLRSPNVASTLLNSLSSTLIRPAHRKLPIWLVHYFAEAAPPRLELDKRESFICRCQVVHHRAGRIGPGANHKGERRGHDGVDGPWVELPQPGGREGTIGGGHGDADERVNCKGRRAVGGPLVSGRAIIIYHSSIIATMMGGRRESRS